MTFEEYLRKVVQKIATNENKYIWDDSEECWVHTYQAGDTEASFSYYDKKPLDYAVSKDLYNQYRLYCYIHDLEPEILPKGDLYEV